MSMRLRILLLFISQLYFAESSDVKLSASKLLLPYYSNIPINYTIRGHNGDCYQWHSGTPEVATVTPIDDFPTGCSNEAVITAIWQSAHRAVSTIYARVITTGHVVKCDVIVDDVSRIEIETTTQELYLHNTPESLVVTAYDEYGNTFSTLEGIPFEWRISGDTGDGKSVLRFLTWKESEYVTPSAIANLERMGLQGHMQLVSGLRTGSALVVASLHEAVYSKVGESQVRLLVMANAQLSPAIAYLIPFAQLSLRIVVVQQGHDEEIQMPSSQYHLQVNDTSLVELDPLDGCTITAKMHGQTQVTLLDRNVEEALENLHALLNAERSSGDKLLRVPRRRPPTTLIHVVEPAYLAFSLIHTNRESLCQLASNMMSTLNRSSKSNPRVETSPTSRTWVMEVGKIYVISIDVHDRNSRRLHPADNLRLEVNFPVEYFQVLESTLNGTLVSVRPISPGFAVVNARLSSLVDKNNRLITLDTSVSGNQEVTIYKPIHVNPPVLLLPWSYIDGNQSEGATASGYQLVATGASEHFSWIALPIHSLTAASSSPLESGANAVVSVDQSGQVLPRSCGDATVVALSQPHTHLCGSARIIVQTPASLQFIPGPSELVLQDGPTRTVLLESNIAQQDSGLSLNNTILTIGLAVLDSQGRPMADCRQMNILIRPLDPTVVQVIPGFLPPITDNYTMASGALSMCLRFRVTGMRIGFSELEATYTVYGSSEKTKIEKTLSTRFPLAVYRNTLILSPSSAVTHIAVGSSRAILMDHGPRPWPLKPEGYFVEIVPNSSTDRTFPILTNDPHKFKRSSLIHWNELDGNNLDYSINPPDHWTTFTVRCEDVGRFVASVRIGNRPSSQNLFPIVMSSDLTIHCDLPRHLRLIPQPHIPLVQNGIPPCPYYNTSLTDSLSELPVSNTVPLRVALSFIGSGGFELDAFDSLHLSTSLLLSGGGSIEHVTSIVRDPKPPIVWTTNFFVDTSIHSSLQIRLTRPYFVITPAQMGSSVGRIIANVEAQLNPSVSAKITSKHLYTKLSWHATRSIRFDPTIYLTPSDHLRLFNHPEAESSFEVIGGSGHIHFVASTTPDSTISSVDAHLSISELSMRDTPDTDSVTSSAAANLQRHNYRIRALHPGRIVVRVVDICFPALSSSSTDSPAEIPLIVDVVSLGSLRLWVPDLIELGGQTIATVEALDNEGLVLPLKYSRLLGLQLITQTKSRDDRTNQTVILVPDSQKPLRNLWQHTTGITSGKASGQAQFTVRGIALGWTTLLVTTTRPKSVVDLDQVVRSNSVEIQVFAPLTMSPCNFNLLLGAEYELRVFGGPQSASIEFSALSKSSTSHRPHLTILKTGQAGVLVRASGSPGWATIQARASSSVSIGSNSSESADGVTSSTASVYSEASCAINIVQLSGVRIGCPLAAATGAKLKHAGSFNSFPEDRLLLSCGLWSESTPGCGSAPLWVEGVAALPSGDAQSGEPLGSFSHPTNVISPLAMSGLVPPLRFIWRISPPHSESSSIARLTHTLKGFNVDPSEADSASGITLIGLSSGRVSIHLTVEATDPNGSKQLLGTSGDTVTRLTAQLNVIIIPQLGLIHPPVYPVQSGQLLLTPRTQFQLKPWSDVLNNGHVVFGLVSTSTGTGQNETRHCNETHGKTPLIILSSTGLIQTGSLEPGADIDCQITVRLTYWPSVTDTLKKAIGYDPFYVQTLHLDVAVRSPRYVVPTVLPLSSPGIHHTSGLPVGGPYRMVVTYHDELGRVFDAVADDYIQLQTYLHRSDLVSVQLIKPAGLDRVEISTAKTFQPYRIGFFSLFVANVLPINGYSENTGPLGLPPFPSGTLTMIQLGPSGVDDTVVPVFLNLLNGGELNPIGTTSIPLSRWICLPRLTGKGHWFSSDSSVLWVDPASSLLLARTQGKAYLMYAVDGTPNGEHTLPMNTSYFWSNTHHLESLTYLTQLEVTDLKDVPLTLIPLQQSTESDLTKNIGSEILLPFVHDQHQLNPSAVGSIVLRFAVQFPSSLDPPPATDKWYDTCPMKDDTFRKRLTSISPFHCAAQLENFDGPVSKPHSSLPSWLVVLALWHQNESLAAQERSFEGYWDVSPALDQLVTVQLEPLPWHSPFVRPSTPSHPVESIYWQCVVRLAYSTNPTSYFLGLILEPGARLGIELRQSEQTSSTYRVLSHTSAIVLPGFQPFTPPLLPASSSTPVHTELVAPIQINNPRDLTRRILIFVPPTTADYMERLGLEHLLVRSKTPGLIDVIEPFRPVRSLIELSQILTEYAESLPKSFLSTSDTTDYQSRLLFWHNLITQRIVQQVENDAAMQQDDIIKRNLFWTATVKASLSESAVDTLAHLVVSLRLTGQHVLLPVHLRLPSSSAASDAEDASSTGLVQIVAGFSSIHLISLLVITILLAVVLHVLLRSAVVMNHSNGSITKDLPSPVSPSKVNRASPRMLWSQTRYPNTSPTYRTPFTAMSYPTGYSPNLSLSGPLPGGVSPYGDFQTGGIGTNEERQLRQMLRGGSPSRLRDTFDSL